MGDTSESKGLSLLEKVKSVPISRRSDTEKYGKQEAELAIAWLQGEVRYTQISKELGRGTASTTNFLLMSMKAGLKLGMIEIKKGGKNNG